MSMAAGELDAESGVSCSLLTALFVDIGPVVVSALRHRSEAADLIARASPGADLARSAAIFRACRVFLLPRKLDDLRL